MRNCSLGVLGRHLALRRTFNVDKLWDGTPERDDINSSPLPDPPHHLKVAWAIFISGGVKSATAMVSSWSARQGPHKLRTYDTSTQAFTIMMWIITVPAVMSSRHLIDSDLGPLFI